MSKNKKQSLETGVSVAMQAQRNNEYNDAVEKLLTRKNNNGSIYIPEEDTYYGSSLPEFIVSTSKGRGSGTSDTKHPVYESVENKIDPSLNQYRHWTEQGKYNPVELATDLDFGILGAGQLGTKAAVHTAKVANQIFNPYNRVGHVMNVLEPLGYSMENFQNVIPEIKTILKGKSSDFTKSEWYNRYINIKHPRFSNRIEAYKLWGRRVPSSKVYVKNSDGTYSYNLRSLKENNLFSDEDFEIATDRMINQGWGYDKITGNGGNINTKLIDPNTIHIEDVWDLQPFKDLHLFTNTAKDIGKKLPDKISNKLIDYGIKLDNKLKNVEVSPLLGGKPFTLSQDIPVIENNRSYFVDWSKIKRYGGKKSLETFR